MMMNASFAVGYPVLEALDNIAGNMRWDDSIKRTVALGYMVEAVRLVYPELNAEAVRRYLGQSMELYEYTYREA